MALTRKMLQGMNLTEEQVDAIIEEHTNVKSSLQKKMDDANEELDALKDVEKENRNLKKQLENKDGENWEEKFNEEHEAFENFKKDIEAGKQKKVLEKAYAKLLKEQGIGEKHIDSIIRVTDFKGMKVDKDGNLEKTEELVKDISEKWSGFKVNVEETGAGTQTPPKGGSTKYNSREEIMKIKNTTERQEAIAANPQLF